MKTKPRIQAGRPLAFKLTLLAALIGCSPALQAAARTDGSAGRVVTLSGAFTVPQTLGTVAGGNLFHSFQSFSVAPGESATFTTSTPSLQNVIARVTGGAASTFNGPLRLEAAGGGSPALFFINPAGITFGAGGSVDVPGALHLSTANVLKLADGSVYAADLSKGSSFSAAAPEAFGFLGGPAGAITVQDKANLTLLGGERVSLTAGDISLSDAGLTLLGGSLRLAAVGSSATDIGLSAPLPAAAGRLVVDQGALVLLVSARPTDTGEVAVTAGDVVIGSAARPAPGGITSYGTAAGAGSTIRIQAARGLSLQGGGSVVAYAEQDARAGDVDIRVGGGLQISSGASVSSFTTGSGDAGAVRVAATGTIVLDGEGAVPGAGIGSESSGSGASGNVSVSAGAGLTLLRGGLISSSSFTAGPGGRVSVDAASLTLDHQGAPGSTAIASNSSGSGAAGAVDVKVSGALALLNGGSIQSSTTGLGPAGAVTVAAGSIRLRHGGNGPATGIVSESGSDGAAGRVDVTAQGDLAIQDSARISSSAFASGPAGAVKVSSATLTLEGERNGSDASAIASITKRTGDAGTVDVVVRDLLSITSGLISTSTEGSGKGGSVSVSAGRIAISNQATSQLSGITSDTAGTGGAGSVNVTATDALSMKGGALISSSTYAQGAAGSVSVSAGRIEMTGEGAPLGTRIASETEGSGPAGSVQVVSRGELSIVNQAAISSSAYASGPAGLVRVQAGNITIDRLGSALRTGIGSVAFSGTGDGGNVEVNATGALALRNGGEVSSSTSTAGAAGSVKVSAERIALSGSASINSGAAAGSSGQTGSVAVSASQSLNLTDSRLSIENQATVARPDAVLAGSLSVAAPRIQLSHAEITASSTGNVAASPIVIDTGVLLAARERSAINTSAVSGQGGAITLGGGGTLWLDHSRLTTSVTGTSNGNGGPIRIDAPVIVLNTGFVQANTAVADARGGDVSINADAPGVLIASGQQLISGGRPVRFQPEIQAPNVIQAARPDGVNGSLRVASPRLDLSASLAPLGAPRLDFAALEADLCRIGDGSSLTPVGRGAITPSIAERVRPAP